MTVTKEVVGFQPYLAAQAVAFNTAEVLIGYILMAYIVMACVVMASVAMPYVAMAYALMGYSVGLHGYGLHLAAEVVAFNTVKEVFRALLFGLGRGSVPIIAAYSYRASWCILILSSHHAAAAPSPQQGL